MGKLSDALREIANASIEALSQYPLEANAAFNKLSENELSRQKYKAICDRLVADSKRIKAYLSTNPSAQFSRDGGSLLDDITGNNVTNLESQIRSFLRSKSLAIECKEWEAKNRRFMRVHELLWCSQEEDSKAEMTKNNVNAFIDSKGFQDKLVV